VKNPLPICYRQPGICYRRPGVHQAAVSTNRQQIVNPFPVIVNLTAPKSAVSSTIYRESIDSHAQSSDNRQMIVGNRPIHPLESTVSLPIFSGYLPIRSLLPLAFSLSVT
jgi:hypothetical protein